MHIYTYLDEPKCDQSYKNFEPKRDRLGVVFLHFISLSKDDQ